MSIFENYTPHTIVVKFNNDESISYPSFGVARVTEEQVICSKIENIEIRKTCYKDIIGLPEQADNKKYIVSMVVAQANLKLLKPRTDLVSPDTGRTCIRDEKGQITAVTGFIIY